MIHKYLDDHFFVSHDLYDWWLNVNVRRSQVFINHGYPWGHFRVEVDSDTFISHFDEEMMSFLLFHFTIELTSYSVTTIFWIELLTILSPLLWPHVSLLRPHCMSQFFLHYSQHACRKAISTWLSNKISHFFLEYHL